MSAPRGGEMLSKRGWLRLDCDRCGPEYLRLQRTGVHSNACVNCWSRSVKRTWGALWVGDDGEIYFVPEGC